MEKYSYKAILKITAPLMLGTFVQSIVTITDAVFVSELGDVVIGAFGNGSLLYISLFMFCRGLADGVQITVANKDGAGQSKSIGELLFNAQIFQLFLSGFLFAILFIFGEAVIIGLSESGDVAQAMIDFIKVRGWGLFFAAQHMILVGFFIGLGRTNIILVSALLIAVCNIFLDYVFIHGNMGIPAMGLQGAPLASSISELVGFLFLLIYLFKAPAFNKYGYKNLRNKLNLSKHLSLLKLSFPLMLQGVLSLSTWLVFFTLIEHMGTAALEAANNIKYMYFLAFVPLFGFGAATRTIVSNLVGQGKRQFIPEIQRRIILLSVLFTVVFFHGAVLYPETLILIVDHNPNMDPQVLSDSVYILKFVSGSIFIFSFAVVYLNSVAGLGETKMTFVIELLAILLYLTGCYYFIYLWEWDIKKIWWVEYIYFISLGLFSFMYLLYYQKKQ
jgi:MATE family multidrug resistance protein